MFRRTFAALGGSSALIAAAAVTATMFGPAQAQEAAAPNIVVIWGDDIGQFNISAYNMGKSEKPTPFGMI